MAAALLAGVTAVCRAQAGEGTRNYIERVRMLDAAGSARLSTVTYYDGLGLSEETVAVGAGASGMSVVSFSGRDRAGRVISEVTAPFGMTGEYVPGALVLDAAGSFYGDSSPARSVTYEQSALGRTLSSTGPGQAWHNAAKSVDTEYLTNEDNNGAYGCLRFTITDSRTVADTVLTLGCSGRYRAGSLYVTRTTDEDGHVSIDFRDSDGHTVLLRRAGSMAEAADRSGRADTYFVYDVTGRLTAVLQPMLAKSITGAGTWPSSHDGLRRFAYLYIYDGRGRLRASRLPGCAWSVMRRDRAGQLVYTQDGHMRQSGKALLSLSDELGRPCVRAIVPASFSLADGPLSQIVKVTRNQSGGITGTFGGYSVIGNSLPSTSVSLLKSIFYDDYSFLDFYADGADLAYRDMEGYDCRWTNTEAPGMSARGWQTGSLTCVQGSDGMLGEAVYYDSHGNVIQRHAHNLMGGAEHYYYRLSFTGKPLAVLHVHTTADTSISEERLYAYDHADRLLSEHVVRDGVTSHVLTNAYDELGRPVSVRYGNGDESMTTVTTARNVRGWTTAISNLHFSQRLHYQDSFGDASPCWNGNISAMEWSSPEFPTSTGNFWQSYSYTYDGLQRLTGAAYSECAGITARSPVERELMNARDYSCSYAYDLHGNVTSLRRKGMASVVCDGCLNYITYGDIDNLSLSYDGNRLVKVTDTADPLTYAGAMDFRDGVDKPVEYAYDKNGNLTADLNKGINLIMYNILNLPEYVQFTDGHSISYAYDADGNKLKTTVVFGSAAIVPGLPILLSDNDRRAERHDSIWSTIIGGPKTLSIRTYCDNHVYLDGRLERTLNPHGYTDSLGNDFFYIRDYLGNVRSVIDASGNLVEVNDYYPYGALMNTLADNPSQQPYKYGAKELDRTAGLDLYDSQARQYDPLLGRTTTVDPHSSAYFHTSHYVWCAGNPVRNIDPDGKRVWSFDEKGMISLVSESDCEDVERFILVDIESNPMKDKDGNPILIDIDKGSVESMKRYPAKPYDYDVLKIRGDENAKKLYHFLSEEVGKRSKVEFAHIKTGVKGKNGPNYITTSHRKSEDASMIWLYNYQLRYKYHIPEFSHSHPGGSAASENDNKFKKYVIEYRKEAKLNIPKFNIYNVKEKEEQSY